MPLNRGKSQKVIGENIAELQKGKTFEKTKKAHGAETARKQSIAIALDEARKSGAKIPKPKK